MTLARVTRRSLLSGAAACALTSPASALFFHPGGSGITGAQTILAVTLSNNTFTGGSPGGTVVGAVAVSMSFGLFSGSLSLTGADAASFTISGSNLVTVGVVANGTYSINIVATQGGAIGSPFTQPETVTGASVTVFSLTLANTSGSPSPTPTPVRFGMQFKPGQVPAGSIATPTLGGVSLAHWQADNRTFWNDGSLRNCVYRVLLTAGIAANSTAQLTFPVTVAAWPNTSSKTVADLTANSDFKVAVTNLHTAQILGAGANTSDLFHAFLTIGGGAVTGGTVVFQSGTSGNGTYNVSQGNGTGANITIGGGVITVNAAGTGYTLEGTGHDGIFNASFNQAVTNNTYVKQYAKGGVCNAWEARMQFLQSDGTTKRPHFNVIFYVEQWLDAAGAILAHNATAHVSNIMFDTVNHVFNLTYNADWKNGSTVIRGTTNGDLGYTGIMQYAASGFRTVDQNGQEDWTANDAAYKAIIVQRTPTECDQQKSTGLIIPTQAIATNIVTPTIAVSFTTGNNELGNIPKVIPMSEAGIRAPMGTGGSGHNEGIYADHAILHWLQLRQGNTVAAAAWLKCARGVAVQFAGAGLGSPLLDPTTFYVPNVIPAATQPFSGMTPTHENLDFTSILLSGYTYQMLQGGSGGGSLAASYSPYHLPNYEYYIYLLEGAQWAVDALTFQAGSLPFDPGPTNRFTDNRIAFGGTTYYGQMAICSDSRLGGWSERTVGMAAAMMPTIWADGATNIEQQYAQYILANSYAMRMALIPFTGTVTIGSGSFQIASKPNDWTGTGVFSSKYLMDGTATHIGDETAMPFMDNYVFNVCCFLAWLHQGAVPNIASFREHFKLYMAGVWAYPAASHYISSSYVFNVFTKYQGAPINPWSNIGNLAAPTSGVMIWSSTGNPGANRAATFTFTAGNANVVVGGEGGGTYCKFNSVTGAAYADGSAIMFTSTSAGTNGGGLGVAPPAGITLGQWYYMKAVPGTSNSQINLFSDQAMTIPVIPAGSAAGVYAWGVPANTLPVDGNANGTYQSGNSNSGLSYAAQWLGTMRLAQAYGATDTTISVTDAIAVLTTIANGLGINYLDDPLYAYDNAL